MFSLKPNCNCEVSSAPCSLDRIIKSNNLPTILLRVIALKLSDVHLNYRLSFGTGIIVPTSIDSGLTPCISIVNNTYNNIGPFII